METGMMINFLLGTVSFGLGFFVRELWIAVKNLRTDLDNLRVHLAQDYVSKVDLKGLEQRIMAEFDEIKDMIKQKVDK